MASSKRNQLKATTENDELLNGQYDERKIDSSGDSKKKGMIVALEMLADRNYAGRINISYNRNTQNPDCIHML